MKAKTVIRNIVVKILLWHDNVELGIYAIVVAILVGFLFGWSID